MLNSHEQIENLRAAVKLSPDNVPLRMLLADALAAVGRFEDAEAEYTVALASSPNDAKLMLSLATVCFQAGKYSKSLVLVEDLIKRDDSPARAHLLYARLLLNEGRVEQAVDHYKRAVRKDASAADPELADRLGVAAGSKSEVVDGRIRQSAGGFDDDESPAELAGGAVLEASDIDFDDVGGMEEVKEQVRMKIIYPLTHADTFRPYGKKVGGGILLYGPPGCGKTYLARATAGEIDARFLAVGLHHVLDMWIGTSERNLHQIFEVARVNKPCVLFFDEVDALAASRSDMKHSAGRHVIDQFLNELDGVDTNNDGVLILAATNAPWHVDSAFRRPGRFDRILFIPPPDAPAL